MAKFLDSTGISYYLEQIIKKSNERLILISPFLKINNRIKQLLVDKDRLKIDIRVIYGKKELQPKENNWLISMNCIIISFCENLHAKCYMNENEALITSMNLYEFSQANNIEMGIYVTKETDEELFNDIYKEAKRLIRISKEKPITLEKEIQKNSEISSKKSTNVKKINEQGEGHCIRCNKSIKLNPLVPYCKDCYKIWNKYGDNEYPEEYCHICGTEKETTMLKPTCYPCFKKNKNKLEFNI